MLNIPIKLRRSKHQILKKFRNRVACNKNLYKSKEIFHLLEFQNNLLKFQINSKM